MPIENPPNWMHLLDKDTDDAPPAGTTQPRRVLLSPPAAVSSPCSRALAEAISHLVSALVPLIHSGVGDEVTGYPSTAALADGKLGAKAYDVGVIDL